MYAKVFSQIYDGTLCTHGPWEALVTFQQFLVLADPEGHVDMTPAAISRRTTIPIQIIEKGIAALMLEDLESRTPTENGRRLIHLSEGRNWGWKVVNYKHYRELKREEDRRDYHREYWHKRKDKLNKNSTTQPDTTKSTEEVDSRKETVDIESIVPPLASPLNPVSKAKPKNHGTHLPADWQLDQEQGDWAMKERNLSASMVAGMADRFKDYWIAVPGQKGVKLDWDATWRNWVRSNKQ